MQATGGVRPRAVIAAAMAAWFAGGMLAADGGGSGAVVYGPGAVADRDDTAADAAAVAVTAAVQVGALSFATAASEDKVPGT